MPRIEKIGNVVLYMYAKDHNPPHFHAVTKTSEALVTIADRTILEGHIPGKARPAVLEWAAANEELMWKWWRDLNP